MNLDLDDLKNLIATLEEGGVNEFEYEDDTSRVRLSFGRGATVAAAAAPQVTAAAAPAAGTAPAAAAPAANVAFITSPFVGTFYEAPSPDADPFTAVGKAIKPGQTLCIVEAMKLMNEIESDVAGTVLEVLVENGTSVEFGQKLFKVSKS
jgi:acetyl-CoA carboxylase biotin carboxyl carrier protein